MGISVCKLYRSIYTPLSSLYYSRSEKNIPNLRKLQINYEIQSDEIKNAYKDCIAYAKRNGYTRGKLLINIHYDKLLKEFQLSVIEATGIGNRYKNVYVKVTLVSESYSETGSTDCTQGPDSEWFTLFLFQNLSMRDIKTARLSIELKNHSMMRDEHIGYLFLPLLYAINTNKELLCYREIQNRYNRWWIYRGYDVLTGLQYDTSLKVLTVTVITVRNIELTGLFKNCCPCLYISLISQGKKVALGMTDILYENHNPVFNECFTFNISNEFLVCSHLVIDVVNYGNIIGTATIGTEKGCEAIGYKHWHDLLNNVKSGKYTEYWHRVKKCSEPKI